jgi:cyclic pyranopterin phosphate synthase
MPEEEYEFTQASKLMKASEIESLARTFVAEGVNKIRLTGGEPLVRKDAAEIISTLGRMNIDLSLTTNGARVHDFIDVFLKANIKSINVSLDTLQADKFQIITRRNIFQQVKDNINLLLQNQIRVKINVVVMKGLNDMEIVDFIEWTKDQPIEVRFIEFMPFAGNRWTSNQVVSLEDILNLVSSGWSKRYGQTLPGAGACRLICCNQHHERTLLRYLQQNAFNGRRETEELSFLGSRNRSAGPFENGRGCTATDSSMYRHQG